MKHLFFHNDIDGICSCAAFCSFTNALDDSDYVLHPVISSLRGARFEAMLRGLENIHVFDYQYDPRACLWIDHHQADQVGYEPILNPNIAYDYTAKSAVSLTSKWLEKFHGRKIADDVVAAADMIDSANYPSIEYIFTDTSPMMVLRAVLELEFPSETMYCRIVEVMARAGMDIKKTNAVLDITSDCVKQLQRKAIAVKNHIEVFGKMSVVRQRYPLQNPRYSEIFAVNTKYNIRISDASKTEKHISISYNKWHSEPNPVHIGRYLMSAPHCKRGGGHFNVGGCVVDTEKVESFLDNFSILIGE